MTEQEVKAAVEAAYRRGYLAGGQAAVTNLIDQLDLEYEVSPTPRKAKDR